MCGQHLLLLDEPVLPSTHGGRGLIHARTKLREEEEEEKSSHMHPSRE